MSKKSNSIACLYVLYDNVAKRYGDIFQAQNDDAVRRQFTEIFKRNFGKPYIPVNDMAVVRLATVESSDDPKEIWPIIANMTEPIIVLKGNDVNYDEVRETDDAACSDHSVPETV